MTTGTQPASTAWKRRMRKVLATLGKTPPASSRVPTLLTMACEHWGPPSLMHAGQQQTCVAIVAASAPTLQLPLCGKVGPQCHQQRRQIGPWMQTRLASEEAAHQSLAQA
eukprot:CAMPEP_0115563484 /NCGR_PEP_ID=MMETSP0271-20121206/102057_1 /TAXON_ID=71861 /ORGANISM="Scrippsiella trochoidea, Strain CCMP3099" /LENGTH=109 /DNA_ID=CAMNT_0002997691 /DNA_START=76 /DNA_END=405 /DNA_ORIENTATION=-